MASKFSFNRMMESIAKLMAEEEIEHEKPLKTARQKAHDDEIRQAILVLCAGVIRCNRNFTSDTEKFVHQFFKRQFVINSSRANSNTIIRYIDSGTESYTKMACKELKMLTTHDSRLTIIEFLFGVAGADDFINAKEIRCIHRIASYLGIGDKDFAELKHHFSASGNPYKILGLNEGATREQVRVAYRRMVLKFHPDKRASHLSEEEANIKFREIKRAYEAIINAAGHKAL